MSSHSENSWIILARAFIRFFRMSIENIGVLIGRSPASPQVFPSLDQIFADGPENFQKKPTAIRAGRAVFTFLLSFFHYVPQKK